MLKSLEYSIKFSSTGKSFSNKLNFQPGLTVITGPNERGKSLILEMIEYAWFGTAALRGQLSDYETINVDMTWESRGEDHTVSRHGSVQTLDKTKAVGASAVNKAILDLLGIDLDVFRIACSAKQGELDKLTARMRPTERRKMVDEVIGLNHLEAIEKLCKAESSANRRLVEELAKKVSEPEPPLVPENYYPSETLEAQYKAQLKIEAEREQLLKIVEPTLPAEPAKGEFEDDVEDYESIRERKEAERAGIERTLRTIPTASFTGPDIDYAERYWQQQGRGPLPTIRRSEAEDWLDNWQQIQKASESIECPNCGVSFIPGDSKALVLPDEPPMRIDAIKQQLKALDNWEGFQYIEMDEKPKLDWAEVQSARIALAQAGVREKLESDLALIEILPSRADELQRKKLWERQHDIYLNQCNLYVDRLIDWKNAQLRLSQLPDPDPTLENNLRESRTYEEQKRRYDADMVSFQDGNTELERLKEEAEAYHTGAEALKFVRSQVKQHLVPSLNRVASHLLSEMTNGERQKINVDEEFEVSVDGQPVRTLSGSGVSVVNLALRIALGQVLTQKVLPIFLADEIDHDMDPVRAKATHDAIKSLTTTLKQIIVVSHKPIDGDHNIGV